MRAYKIFDLGYDDAGSCGPRTLFRGLRRVLVHFASPNHGMVFTPKRTRNVPLDIWCDAEVKQVTDGSRQTPYQSGFHCFTNLDAVRAWFKTARRTNRVVVRVEINDGARVKPKAVRHTLLADRMKIHSKDWECRIPAEAIE